ncbi:hypothetical protein M422DRAFT_255239 [Sphaerobolus stellatus SS14]|uniref:Uncharacterized protein n=1 Tax=Sphaerobolus stellatus (strain SS14) TaxID=990650 RepID=A0A0C9VTX4_SPHS4|nr:hypothetical protein M422DRAFT_255239 [Sphaerobolus stellatus SS14]
MEWEKDEALDFGAIMIESTIFIESSENFEDIDFYWVLDCGFLIFAIDDAVHNVIFDTASPVIDASDIPNVGVSPVDMLLKWIDNTITTIQAYHPSAGHWWVHLGSANGLRIQGIRRTLNVLLAKEAWCPWAQASFIISLPTWLREHPGDFFMLWNIWMGLQMKDEVDAKAWADLKWHQFIGQDNVLAQLSVDSCITVWGDQEGDTVITIHKREWSKSVSVALVKNWTDEMDKGSFSFGSTIEKFQFIYAVAMVNWWGDSEVQQWYKGSAGKLEDWLASLICTATPDLLRKYTRVLKYTQSTSHSLTLVIYITLALDIADSRIPSKDWKRIQGAWGGEAYTLTPMGIESRSSDGEFEGAIVVDTPCRKCKLPDSEEPTTQENLYVMKKLKPSDDIPANQQSESQVGDSTTVVGTVPHVQAIVQEIPMAAVNPVSGKKCGRMPKVEANEVVLTSVATEPATTKRMGTRAHMKKGGSEADKVIVNSSTLNYT